MEIYSFFNNYVLNAYYVTDNELVPENKMVSKKKKYTQLALFRAHELMTMTASM